MTKCSDCGKRPISAEQRGNGGSLCEDCADWASWENEHDDNAHEEISSGEEMAIPLGLIASIREVMVNCPICNNFPHPRDTFKKGHTNTAAKSYTSHAECGHARTPKDRELCRRARRAQSKLAGVTRMDDGVVAVDRANRKGRSLS